MNMKFLAALPVALALALPAMAQDDYPDRSIRIVHGFGAGGNADTVSRILAEAMTEGLGQPVVVESRPGAGGTVASGYVANADADGYTLQLMVGGHTVAAGLYNSLPYDSVNDFTFLSIIGQFPVFVSARAGEYGSLTDVIAAASAEPGSVRIGHSGVGSTQHLTGELLDIVTEADFLHIPYAGGAAAVTAMMGGEVDIVIDTGTAIFGQADAGVLDVLAVTSGERWPDNPDVPTVAETVAPGFNVVSWTGLGAPDGLPDNVVEVLTAEISRVMALPEVRERIAALGANPVGSSSAEFRDLVETQIKTWTEVITTAGVERRRPRSGCRPDPGAGSLSPKPDGGTMSATPETLYASMLRRSLWVITTRPARGPGMQDLLPAHLDYQVAMEREGKLFGAGPIFEDGGDVPTGGMIIVRADSEDEAHALARADPFHAHGLRRYTVHRWLLNEGAMTVTVRYSDQSAVIG